MDFTLDTYRSLLEALQQSGYVFMPFADYCKGKRSERFIVLRHDVDNKPENSLRIAQVEHALGIKATYYFRVGKESNQPTIIRAIVALGHEIGYHYEDMALTNGEVEKAYNHFTTWLEYFRHYYAVETICMHGAPTSAFDAKDLWKHYDYKTLGIIGEPYLDTDFSQLFYLTDTGRRWDGYKVSVRDKIPTYQDQWIRNGWVYRTTNHILKALVKGELPAKIMITTHPQRWTNARAEWGKEWIIQNTKNIIKRALLIARK